MAAPDEQFDQRTFSHLDASVRDLSYSLDTTVFRLIKDALPPIRGMGLAAQQMAVAVRDSIKMQNKLAGLLSFTGRNLANNTHHLDQVGVTFEQAGDAIADTFLTGVRRNVKDTVRLLAQSKSLGLDTRALADNMTFNRRTLGISTDASIQLARSFVEVGSQFGITGDAIVKSMQALRPALESAAASFGPGTAAAIEEAAATMTGRFGLGAQKALESIMSKLVGGTAESTKLAMRLGVPLELLASDISGDIVEATKIALNRVTELTSGFKGTPGAGLIKGALSKSLGINDAFINLGIMLNDPLQQMNSLQIEQLQAQRLQNDLTQALSVIMTPMKVDVLKLLNIFVGWINFASGFIAGVIKFSSKFLITLFALKALQRIRAFKDDKRDGLLTRMLFALRTGGRGKGWRVKGKGMQALGFLGGPVGIAALGVAMFGPMLFSAITGKSEEEKRRHREAQEERKRTADALTKSSPHLAELKSLGADMRRAAITWELFQESQSGIGTKTNEVLEKIHDASITPEIDNLTNQLRPAGQEGMN